MSDFGSATALSAEAATVSKYVNLMGVVRSSSSLWAAYIISRRSPQGHKRMSESLLSSGLSFVVSLGNAGPECKRSTVADS